MGLDAVVYRNIENLPESLRSVVALVDPVTGELDFSNSATPTVDAEALLAAEVRIGNISEVAWLREQIESRLPNQCPLILNTVLYSGTHSGDTVGLGQVQGIKLEIAALNSAESSTPAMLLTFLSEMMQLVSAAEIL